MVVMVDTIFGGTFGQEYALHVLFDSFFFFLTCFQWSKWAFQVLVLDTQLTVVYRVISSHHFWWSKMHPQEIPDTVMGPLTAGIPTGHWNNKNEGGPWLSSKGHSVLVVPFPRFVSYALISRSLIWPHDVSLHPWENNKCYIQQTTIGRHLVCEPAQP